MTISVTAIVLSYNRPRMLREALATVRDNAPDEVIVTDDGSAFDVRATVREFCPDARFVIAPPLTLAERLVTPRLGALINRALDLATGDATAYLCDDDLWAPGWLDAVRAHASDNPPHHFVRGNWLRFNDGEALDTATICEMPGFWMTTGNFAHATACARECGARWSEETVACHDAMFLHHCRGRHDMFRVPYLDTLAGYRREHAHNALPYVARETEYAPHAAALFAEGWLE